MSALLVSPLGIGLLLAFVLAVGHRRLPAAARLVLIFLLLLMVLATTAVGANALAVLVERHTASMQGCAPSPARPIVVLAGGHGSQPVDAQDYSALNVASLRRLFGAVQLHRRDPGSTLVVVGGGRYRPAEGALMATLATELGVDGRVLRREVESGDTWENALHVSQMQPPLAEPVWLVTSALHMPRARAAFAAAGMDTCPWPVDFRARPLRDAADFLPSSTALLLSEATLHELFGSIYYRWRAFWHARGQAPR